MERERAERELEAKSEFEKLQEARRLLPMFPYRQGSRGPFAECLFFLLGLCTCREQHAHIAACSAAMCAATWKQSNLPTLRPPAGAPHLGPHKQQKDSAHHCGGCSSPPSSH